MVINSMDRERVKKFERDFLKMNDYDPTLSEKIIKKIYDIDMMDDVLDAFRKYPPEEAVEELNEMYPEKDYEYSLRNITGRNYLHLKTS